MSAPSNPSEIARETLRQMAMRRVAPTPDNYFKVYHEIAGTRADDDASPEQFARSVARRLPRDTAERQRCAHEVDQALTAGDLKAADDALGRYLEKIKATEQPAWNELIASLLRLWEARQHGWTTARKREALDRVLGAADPATLYTRLQGLLRNWNQSLSGPGGAGGDIETVDDDSAPAEARALEISALVAPAAPADARLFAPSAEAELAVPLRALLTLSVDRLVPAFLGEHTELAGEASFIGADIAAACDALALDKLHARMKTLAHRMEMSAADDAEIRGGLLELLRLVLHNIGELVLEDKWMAGQVEMLREIVDGQPNPRTLDEAGRRLKGLIYKQTQLKSSLFESQQHLRTMLVGFLDQLALFADSTGTYHDQLSESARQIASATDIAEIGPMLDKVMEQTRTMQRGAQQAHTDLLNARAQAQEAEGRIAKLQSELDEASRQMRHDQLTGVLNRRGMEEMFDKELARAQRRSAPLSVGVLDIDNFKKFNDTYGHDVGDDALIHLATVVRKYLRPQDSLARYGGEEFVILLPDANEADAAQALVRLQRELTREFFMTGQTKLVITFSAGVTELQPGEKLDLALKRADVAMYQAKQAGRNRVVTSSSPVAPLG